MCRTRFGLDSAAIKFGQLRARFDQLSAQLGTMFSRLGRNWARFGRSPVEFDQLQARFDPTRPSSTKFGRWSDKLVMVSAKVGLERRGRRGQMAAAHGSERSAAIASRQPEDGTHAAATSRPGFSACLGDAIGCAASRTQPCLAWHTPKLIAGVAGGRRRPGWGRDRLAVTRPTVVLACRAL